MKFVGIDRNLIKYLPKGGDTVSKAMRYSVLSGGKRIRPIITIESCKACGGSVKDAMPVACAVEYIHTYSLIHDDLPAMDDDDFRRGKPSCHKVFGEANAILSGDALLTLAFNVIAASAEPKKGLNIIKELSEAIGADGMVKGQALDLENRDSDHFSGRTKCRKMVAVPKIKINLLKTARLFEASAKAGGLAAGASPKKIDALKKFGLYFGLSFQAVDDCLDGEGDNRKEAARLMEKAKHELKIFGKKADRLKAIADHISKRTE